MKRKRTLKKKHLKIVLLNVGPNLLESLGTRNLGDSNEVLHLRRDRAGLHDATWSALLWGFVGGHGGGGDSAHHAQVSRRAVEHESR